MNKLKSYNITVYKLKRFIKSYNKLSKKIQDKFDEQYKKFLINPFDISLKNHALKWKYEWLRSINITWDFRLIFKEYPNGTYEFVDFIDIWTHSFLY